MKKTNKIIAVISAAVLLAVLLTCLSVGTLAKDFSEEYFENNYIITPYWVSEYYDNLSFWHNDNYTRVIDFADVLTDEEEAELDGRIAKIQETYGYDVVVYTDTTTYGWYDEDQKDFKRLAADFYDYFGYGLGDNNSGSIFILCTGDDNRGWQELGTGDVERLYTDKVVDNMNANIKPYLSDRDWYKAVTEYVDDVEELYSTGTVKSKAPLFDAQDIIYFIGFVAVVGLIAGFASMSSAVKNMKTVAQATQANTYVVPGSLNITKSRDHFLFMTQTRVYSPKEKKGGGSSSFSSGGHSFSGGGGRF